MEPRINRAGVLALLALMSSAASAAVHVDVDNTKGPWDGTSWVTAYRTVQKGLDAAAAGRGEVWVAEGTYKPTSTADRSVSIRLKPGVALYGGFKGTETARGQRDWTKSVTILSGDIGMPGDPNDNSYHVVRGADRAAIDGFTITSGNACPGEKRNRQVAARAKALREELSREPDRGAVGHRGPGAHRPGGPPGGRRHLFPRIIAKDLWADWFGGGMYNIECSPTVANCTFTGNTAARGGGGMYNSYGASPVVTSCTFSRNSAAEGGAVYSYDDCLVRLAMCTFTKNSANKGGGVVCRDGSSNAITGCAFTANHARWRGGGVFIDYGSSPTITKCTFDRNTTDGDGGGVYVDDNASQIGQTSPEIRDCTFTHNRARRRGGGVAHYNKCTPTVIRCAFEHNHAGAGGGGVSNHFRVFATIAGCTFAQNSAGKGKADVDTDETSRVTSERPMRRNGS